MKYKNPKDCDHKRTILMLPQVGISANERVVCRDCGKVIRNEPPRFQKIKKKKKGIKLFGRKK
jgi:hypothetical protein